MCGKHCESGDAVVIDMPLQKADLGDIVCVFGTGAYNMTMASNYNGQPRPAVVFVRDGAGPRGHSPRDLRGPLPA